MKKHVLENPELCTGCSACAALCPANSIEMIDDAEGFSNPSIESAICTNCGLCIKACPVLRAEIGIPYVQGENKIAYGVWNRDNAVRMVSSSGGVFSSIASSILKANGLVVGAVFDRNFMVEHAGIDDTIQLSRMRTSKYVQSKILPSVLRGIKEELLKDRLVLFSGTPCQVAGLHSYLRNDYAKLITCDFVCHGVPSPLLWKKYIAYVSKGMKDLVSVNFRDKRSGWKKFSLSFKFSSGKTKSRNIDNDPYLIAFQKNLSLRKSCYKCGYARLPRLSDITLGDFWGIEKIYRDKNIKKYGVSLVLVNNEKGEYLFSAVKQNIDYVTLTAKAASIENPALSCPSSRPEQRNTFYKDMLEMDFSKLVERYKLKRTRFNYIKYYKNKFLSTLFILLEHIGFSRKD